MHQKYFILFLSLIIPEYISSITGVDTKSSTTYPTSGSLPLTMIKQNDGTLLNPKQISTYNANEDGYLIKGTTFKPNTLITDGHQVFFCGPDDTNGGIAMNKFLVGTDQYCSFLTDLENSELLQCAIEPQPFIRKLFVYKPSIDTHVRLSCGPKEKKGKMYAFQYKACTTTRTNEKSNGWRIASRAEIEIYKFCYSQKENQVLYTEHTIKSPRLLGDARLAKDQEQRYPIMTENFQCSEADFEKIQQTYDEMENQNEKEKLLVQKFDTSWIGKSPLHVQKFVPHEDLAFATWRKTTYHVANYKPMREDTMKLWEYINQLIREDAIKNNKEYKIYTGAFNVPEGEQTSYAVPVADIWIKIIQHPLPISTNFRTESFAVLLNNNLDHQSMISLFHRICAMDLCKDGFIGEFPDLGDTARCCVVSRDISSFFNININNTDATFVIESFKNGTKSPRSSVTEEISGSSSR